MPKLRWLLLSALLAAPAAADPGDARRELARAQHDQRQLRSALGDLDAQLAAIERELVASQAQIDRDDRERLARGDALDAAERALAHEGRRAGAWAHLLYRLHRRGLARAVFSNQTTDDLWRQARYIEAILRANRSVVRRFIDRVQARADAAAQARADRGAAEIVRGQIRLQEAALRARRAQRLADLEAATERADRALRALAGDARGSDLLAATQIASEGADFAELEGALPWPVAGAVMRPFGAYVDARSGQPAWSAGVDIQADRFYTVRVVADGVVQRVEHLGAWGQVVVVGHGAYTTVYAHLSRIDVRAGQRVAAGDAIGLVGETGLTDGGGPRLHFEIREGGEPVDPMGWLVDYGD